MAIAERAGSELSDPQNSIVREVTKGPIIAVVRWAHHQRLLRKITPNNITDFGAITQPIGSALSVLISSKDELTLWDRVNSGLATIIPQIPDAFDGKLAIVYKEEEPEKVDPDGDLRDFKADRWGEFCTAAQRMAVAYNRGSKWGVVAAFLSGVTNPLTSHYRAEAEVRGKIVPEVRLGLESAGNRFGRAITSMVSAAIPEAQPGIDTFSAISNTASAYSRRKIALNGAAVNYEEMSLEEIEKIEHMQERAEKRLKISRWAIVGTTVGLAATLVLLKALDKEKPLKPA